MGVLATLSGIFGWLSIVMGIITALAIIPEVAGLTWLFWFLLAIALLLCSIALTVGRKMRFTLNLPR